MFAVWKGRCHNFLENLQWVFSKRHKKKLTTRGRRVSKNQKKGQTSFMDGPLQWIETKKIKKDKALPSIFISQWQCKTVAGLSPQTKWVKTLRDLLRKATLPPVSELSKISAIMHQTILTNLYDWHKRSCFRFNIA